MPLKGGTICVVRGCSSRTGGDTSLFSFPMDPVRAECWLRNCNREDLLDKNIDALHRNFKVCEKHFDIKYITQGGTTRKHLFQQAVPTIFPHAFKHSLEVHADSTEEPPKKVTVISDIRIESSDVTSQATTSTIVSAQAAQNISDKIIDTSDVPSQATTSSIASAQAAQNISDTLQVLEVFPVSTPSRSAEISTPSCSYEISTPSTSTQTSAILSSGTPRKVKLRQKLKAMRRRKSMDKSGHYERDWTLEDFNKICDKFLGDPLSGIVKAHAKLKNVKPLARRYSSEYKQFALTLYFLGPRTYFFLSKILCLPSKRCLESITQKITIKPGFQNETIFKSLEIKSQTMFDQDRHCIICIDEISLKGNLYYHTGRDEIVGLHDLGNGNKQSLIAQNACVIMVRGLYNNWKQPIAYFFVNTQFCATELCSVVNECVIKLFGAGFHVDALVSDMGSNFVQLSNILGVTPTNPEFKVGDKTIIYLFETCHLIKATRNNLLQNIFYFDEKKTSWSFIDMFFQQDRKQTYRCTPKLTSSHISPTNFEKRRVKFATQVLSNSVASGMNTYVSLGALPAEAMATIEIIEKFDKLLDLLNSSQKNHPNKFKNVFEGSDYQIEYLIEMREFISQLRILNKDGDDVTSRSKFKSCWIITINGILKLWENLKKSDFKYLKTRRVNQDAIEIFFGSIRQQGGNCGNPTPIQFERAFRKLFYQNFLHTTNMNCKDDFGELLMKINPNNVIITNEDFEETQQCKSITLTDYDYRHETMPVQNAFNYVCGYLIKKALNIHSCELCRKYSAQAGDLDYNKLLTHFKAFNNENSVYGGLRSPSEDFVHYIYKLEKIFVTNFDEFSKGNRISHLYLEEMKKVPYSHPCPQFPSLYVIKLFIRMKIFYTLKFSNKEIKSDKGKLKKNRKLTILSHI